MYRNKVESNEISTYKGRNHRIGTRKEALLELRALVSRIDDKLQYLSGSRRNANNRGKKIITKINLLKRTRKRIKHLYHEVFLAKGHRWEAIRERVQRTFEQANNKVFTP
jgi:cell division protein ZapA (FtsZ GTPase activity inhibitor)